MNHVDIHEYAGFGRRTAAMLIDMLIFSFVSAIFHTLLFGDSAVQIVHSNDGVQVFSSGGWTEQLLILFITVFMWIKFMGTPGKLLLGCHIVDAETMQPLKIPQALVRYVAYFVSALPLGLGFFWILWDKRKQGFHDKIAKSVVVIETRERGEDESQKSLKQLMEEAK